MSEEPATKKAKVAWNLTDPTEPLARKDVIAFQKEALFRALNKHRSRAESFEKQLAQGHEDLLSLREQFARVCGALAVVAAKLSDLCRDDPAAYKLCQSIAEGVETDVSAVGDELAVLVDKYVGRNSADSSLASHLHASEVAKKSLSTHNEQLQREVEAVRSYYESLIHSYDREDSETIKRIFKIKDEDHESESKRFKDSPESQAVQIVAKTNDEVKSEASERTDVVTTLEHELQLKELNDQIDTLRATIEELENWKTQRENEITKLRTELAAVPRPSHGHPADGEPDREELLRRLEMLTEENNALTQTNSAFLSKFQKLVQEKEVFTNKLTNEFQTAQEALKKHNDMLEKDLVRIRSTRDEMSGKLAILESQKSKSEILDDLQKVIDLQKERVIKLDNKLEEPSKDALTKELQDLERAFRELSQFAHKKYSEHLTQENIVSKLTVEKSKADQKYFAAMRSKDSILIENKNLSKNYSKSNELIAQLKDIERTLQSKVESLNKQIHFHENNEKRLLDANKSTSAKLMDLTSALGKSKRANEFLSQEKAKFIGQIAALESQNHSSQTESKALKLQLSQAHAKAAKLHKFLASSGNSDSSVLTEELENFRTIVYCSLCSKNWKNTAIKNCGHVFCDQCCKERLAARMRKCPICRTPFGAPDLLDLHM
ncbi:LADA_0H13278g1_1 [Lachancea dasiensis]|uniref:E3 ubiquitin protein ligase n=1 Tax=Lachancea dasiensis TaxID=1072105 RepID=A0A1G4K4C1_9SACH|nr:LADA_0H13278g1_1 [Lachancea dasiensis]